MNYSDYRRALLNAVEMRANCSAQYLQTQPVRISVDGKVLWDGKVEIFQLSNHPQAKQAFGWWFQNKENKTEYVAIMGVPPLDTPLAAVKAFAATHGK